jgi:hypothetical protein
MATKGTFLMAIVTGTITRSNFGKIRYVKASITPRKILIANPMSASSKVNLRFVIIQTQFSLKALRIREGFGKRNVETFITVRSSSKPTINTAKVTTGTIHLDFISAPLF